MTSSALNALLPDPATLRTQLAAQLPHFRHIDWVDSTVSTNADLLERARADSGPLARPWLLGAHLQERGRGRAGRTWQNRVGANLMFSCAFDVFLPPRQLPTLSPLAGQSACVSLRQFISPANREGLLMKWPNDVQWQFAKLAGILVEVTRSGTSRLSPDHYVAIIGMGINLNDARALSQSLNRRVADWTEISHQDQQAAQAQVTDIVSSIAQGWYTRLNHVTAHGFADFPTDYAEVDVLAGQHVNVLDDGRLVQSGIACGVNTRGQLLLKGPDGESAVTVGEISVRTHTAL